MNEKRVGEQIIKQCSDIAHCQSTDCERQRISKTFWKDRLSLDFNEAILSLFFKFLSDNVELVVDSCTEVVEEHLELWF